MNIFVRQYAEKYMHKNSCMKHPFWSYFAFQTQTDTQNFKDNHVKAVLKKAAPFPNFRSFTWRRYQQ